MPAMISEPPTLMVVRRRSGDSAIAATYAAIVRNSSTHRSVLNVSSRSRAFFSWPGPATCSDDTSGGSLSTASGGSPVAVAICWNRSFSSSDTPSLAASLLMMLSSVS